MVRKGLSSHPLKPAVRAGKELANPTRTSTATAEATAASNVNTTGEIVVDSSTVGRVRKKNKTVLFPVFGPINEDKDVKRNEGFAMHARFLIIPVFVIAMAMVFISVSTLAQIGAEPQKSEQQMPEGRFIDLFRKEYDRTDPAETAAEKMDAAISRYIKTCCQDRDAAIELLRNNGFEVSIRSDPDVVEKINRGYDQSRRSWPLEERIEYDEFVWAERGGRFWEIFTKYRVDLFIKGGQVVRVSSRDDTTLP